MTSRSYKFARGILCRGNYCNFLWTFESFPVVSSNNKNIRKMPIIAAVVAHRRYHHKQSDPLMTKPCAKGTTPTLLSAQCNAYQVYNSVTTTPRRGYNNNTVKPMRASVNYQLQDHHQCQQQANFSTTSPTSAIAAAKTLKSKLSGVINLTLTRLVSGDHEESRRFYAKGKGAKGKANVRINEEEMSELIDVEAYRSQLDRLTEQMRDDYAKQLSVRNASGALELLMVDFEGEKYPLQELAQVGRKNPQLAVLNLSSLPDAIQPVLAAINESGMNLNPQQDGTTIYVPLPKVTREHRENLSRNAKSLFVKYKTSYQTVQNRYIKQVRSAQEGVSADLVFSVQQQIMKLASDYIAEAEKLMLTKQKELLQQDK